MRTATAETVKVHAWDNRTWGFRIGGGIAAITAATVGGKKAGLAMLGTAVAIPASLFRTGCEGSLVLT